MILPDELGPWYFELDLWKAGSLAEFGIYTRTASIAENRSTIRIKAIGYIPGNKLWIRGKPDTMAVMFWKENIGHFWTHLTTEEFYSCFPELKR
jgi:hypothetical protein